MGAHGEGSKPRSGALTSIREAAGRIGTAERRSQEDLKPTEKKTSEYKTNRGNIYIKIELNMFQEVKTTRVFMFQVFFCVPFMNK